MFAYSYLLERCHVVKSEECCLVEFVLEYRPRFSTLIDFQRRNKNGGSRILLYACCALVVFNYGVVYLCQREIGSTSERTIEFLAHLRTDRSI